MLSWCGQEIRSSYMLLIIVVIACITAASVRVCNLLKFKACYDDKMKVMMMIAVVSLVVVVVMA